MIRSTDYLRRILAPAEAMRRYDVILVPHCNSFPLGRLRLVGLWGKRGVTIGGARFVEKKYDWEQPNILLVVQTGDESVNQAKSACSTSGLL